ncbi:MULTISPECIES: ChaB family protein [unclassified Microcoleus]|uniref:ChaB family protein n=1 Tax=unclassified Microcoleus TaxID=2642155 RepID=UPI002FCE8B15
MPEQQFDTLPSEAQELPQGAKQIFQAAFKSASEDGMSADGATSVAWNSVKSEYVQEGGTWHHKGDDTNQTRKSVQSGGN